MATYITWAGTAVTYVSGPDAGFPVEVDSGARSFIPGATLPAQNLNFILGSVTRASATIPSLAVNNWMTLNSASNMTQTVSSVIDCVAWDETNKLWVATGSGALAIAISPDDGQHWTALTISGATLPNGQFAIGPVGGGYSLPNTGSGTIRFVSTAGVVTDTGTAIGASNVTGGVCFPNAQGGATGVLYDVGTHATIAYTTVDGTTIVNVTASLPSTWNTAASQPSMNFFTSAPGPANDQLVAFGGVPITDPSMLLHITWNGTTFTYSDVTTMPSGLSNLAIFGVAYNTTDQLWGVMGYDGTLTQIWTSPDLVTWTLAATLGGLWGGLVTVGPYWVSSVSLPVAGITTYRAVASRLTNGTPNFTPVGTSLSSAIFGAGSGFLSQGSGNAFMWGVNGGQASRRVGPV